jgi:PrcB C-terminal
VSDSRGRGIRPILLACVVAAIGNTAACHAKGLTEQDEVRAAAVQHSPEMTQSLGTIAPQFVAQSVREERHYLRRASDLETFWRRFDPSSPPPVVDFSRYDVVVVLMGTQRSGGYSVRVASAERKGRDLVVSVLLCRPEQDQQQVAEVTSPFDVTLVEKWDGSVSYVTTTGRTGQGACR